MSSTNVMGASGENADLKQVLNSYVYGFAPAFLPVAAVISLMSFLYIEGVKKRVLVEIVTNTIVNIIGNFFQLSLSFIILALHYRKSATIFLRGKISVLNRLRKLLRWDFQTR